MNATTRRDAHHAATASAIDEAPATIREMIRAALAQMIIDETARKLTAFKNKWPKDER